MDLSIDGMTRCPPFHEKLLVWGILFSAAMAAFLLLSWAYYFVNRNVLKRQMALPTFRKARRLTVAIAIYSIVTSGLSIHLSLKGTQQYLQEIATYTATNAQSYAWCIHDSFSYVIVEVYLSLGFTTLALLMLSLRAHPTRETKAGT